MAKHRKRSKRPRPAPASAPAVAPPPRERSFWFDFEIPWAKLAVFRVVLFGLLAVDAFLAIRHAPRYDAGNFAVAHLPFLDGLGPGRTGYEIGQLVEAYLFVLAAFGARTRVVVPLAAAIYAWLYFGSQLDSYQHHYLVAVLLAIASFVPWERPPDARPATPVRSWAVRLILVQLAIVYLWAAIGKLDPAWLGGQTLGGQLTGALRSFVDGTIGMRAASIAVIAAEFALAATLWRPRAWKIAAPLGIALHAGIAISGLEIGLFAYLMLGLYLLALPDRPLIWIAGAVARAIPSPKRRSPGVLAAAAALAVVGPIALAHLVRLENAALVARVLVPVPIALAFCAPRRMWPAAPKIFVAHAAALAFWFAADRATDVAVDYYKYWAGAHRRLGALETAEIAYRRLLAIDPDREMAHYHLGRILLRDRPDEAREHLRRAERLGSSRARALLDPPDDLDKP